MMIENAQRRLENFFSRKHSLLTGNATTALYLIIKSLNLPRGSQIMVPNSSCPHVPTSIYLAKHKPIFADIDKNNFSLNIKNIKKNLNNKIKAIIAVHAYGIPCEIEKISHYCKKKNIILIEDAALTFGLKIKNKYTGSFGLASVFSFGKGKVLNAGGGGVILTDNSKLYNNIFYNYQKLKRKNKKSIFHVNKIEANHTDIYNKYFLNKKKYKIKTLFKTRYLNQSHSLLYKFDKNNLKKILFNQKKINKIYSERYKKIKFLYNKLQKVSNNFFKISKSNLTGIPWRFNIFFLRENYRNFVLKNLLKDKIQVSSWHPSLDIFFQTRGKFNYPVSDKLSKQILNIWINEEVDKTYLATITNKIINYKRILLKKNILN